MHTRWLTPMSLMILNLTLKQPFFKIYFILANISKLQLLRSLVAQRCLLGAAFWIMSKQISVVLDAYMMTLSTFYVEDALYSNANKYEVKYFQDVNL